MPRLLVHQLLLTVDLVSSPRGLHYLRQNMEEVQQVIRGKYMEASLLEEFTRVLYLRVEYYIVGENELVFQGVLRRRLLLFQKRLIFLAQLMHHE